MRKHRTIQNWEASTSFSLDSQMRSNGCCGRLGKINKVKSHGFLTIWWSNRNSHSHGEASADPAQKPGAAKGLRGRCWCFVGCAGALWVLLSLLIFRNLGSWESFFRLWKLQDVTQLDDQVRTGGASFPHEPWVTGWLPLFCSPPLLYRPG